MRGAMLTYLWIGLGGALGSIGRAWLSVAVARITGPQFPWGTILINIAGSFIIGFFGTLTVTNGRFSVPPDARAFVMVGICGGFTTFSSFSLQTLELFRDGRMAQALGNVALSVVLCLLAVTAGHYGAAGLHRVHREAAVTEGAVPEGAVPEGAVPVGAVTGGGGMGDVVVAVLNAPETAERLLGASTQWLTIGGGGRLKALAVRLPPIAAVLPSEEVLTAEREAAFRAGQENWAAQLRTMVEAWSSRLSELGIQTDWIDAEGDVADIVAEHGRRADAIVLARPAHHETEHEHRCMHAALFDTGCPVLVVPPGFDGSLGRVVAIAWKDDQRAGKAVRASLPILAAALEVHVLCAGAPAKLPLILREHAIAAQLHQVADGKGPTGERILEAAHRLRADLLVMGAFAHGEWREMVFGGVTRTMLAEADLPLLMRH
jgi:protein CrcB